MGGEEAPHELKPNSAHDSESTQRDLFWHSVT